MWLLSAGKVMRTSQDDNKIRDHLLIRSRERVFFLQEILSKQQKIVTFEQKGEKEQLGEIILAGGPSSFRQGDSK